MTEIRLSTDKPEVAHALLELRIPGVSASWPPNRRIRLTEGDAVVKTLELIINLSWQVDLALFCQWLSDVVTKSGSKKTCIDAKQIPDTPQQLIVIVQNTIHVHEQRTEHKGSGLGDEG